MVLSAIPAGRFHTLIPSEPSPAFGETDELVANWGRKWGAADEVSPVRTLLMRRPNVGMADIHAGAWDVAAEALVDPEKRWYWLSETPPDLDLVRTQYDGFLAALGREGIEVVLAPDLPRGFTKSVFTRDPLITVPGGAIITRLGPRMRRGEEQSITQTVAAAGMPVLGTITGSGIVEGGSVVKLRPDLVAYGSSLRCNQEGLAQLRRILEPQGIEVIDVPLNGFRIHIDGAILMLDHDLALVNTDLLPWQFLETLEALGIELVEPVPEEQWAINSLTVSPRRLFMASHLKRTADFLNRHHGIEIVPVDYSEISKNGGSLHCSTMELVRDW